MAQEKVKIALVGCGGIARAHWRGIKYHAPRVEVTAVVDTNAEAVAAWSERTQSRGFASLDDALRDGDFDAVDLMLPHDLHVEACEACFAAGKHVVLEKPMAPDVASAQRILEVAKDAGTVLMVAEQAQYWPDVLKAREMMDAGAIGDIVTARACFYDVPVFDPDGPIPWRFDLARSGGGICIDGGAHWIRPLRLMLGEIDCVIAVTGAHVPNMQGESWAHALFRFQSGVAASFDAVTSPSPVGPTEDFRITGSKGELVIEHGREGRFLIYDHEHPEGTVVMESFQGKVDSYGVELDDFSNCVLDGTPLAAPPEFSLGELRTALAMYRSVESGHWENVWD